jgi:hypothetical protein
MYNNTTSISLKNGWLNYFSIPLICLFISLFSCNEPILNKIKNKNIAYEISNLHQSKDEIKAHEEKAALVRETDYSLEYEYPVREDESYVITYRFNDTGCFEIKLDIYLNKENDAKNISNGIKNKIESNPEYGKAQLENRIYSWHSVSKDINLELKTQNQERGIINFLIQQNK